MFVRDYSVVLIRLTMLQNIQTGGGFKAVIGGTYTGEKTAQPLLVASRSCLIETVAQEIKHGRGFNLIRSISLNSLKCQAEE